MPGPSCKFANQSHLLACIPWHSFVMRISVFAIALCLLVPLGADAQQTRTYRWVDDDGIVHYGDSVPAEYADLPKQVLNEHAVLIGEIRGKKTAEEIEAERIAAEQTMQRELRLRADRALLATYVTVDEIEMHRDRRVELFQAQSRVTELYLRNLRRRLDTLQRDAGRFKPYSSDPSAPLIDASLTDEINVTKARVGRHESNLLKYHANEEQIIARFDGDINRFKILKGID